MGTFWALFQYQDRLSRYGISIVKIWRSWGRLIFIVDLPTLVRRHLYIETHTHTPNPPSSTPHTPTHSHTHLPHPHTTPTPTRLHRWCPLFDAIVHHGCWPILLLFTYTAITPLDIYKRYGSYSERWILGDRSLSAYHLYIMFQRFINGFY